MQKHVGGNRIVWLIYVTIITESKESVGEAEKPVVLLHSH